MNYVDTLPKSSNFRKGGICETLSPIIALRGMVYAFAYAHGASNIGHGAPYTH